MLGRKIARHGLILVATAFLGGFLSAAMVRLAPGFDTDEAALDPHLNSQSIQALRQAWTDQNRIFRFCLHSLRRAMRGGRGPCISLKQRVGALFQERFPLTLRLVSLGRLMGWAAVVALAFTTALVRVTAYDL